MKWGIVGSVIVAVAVVLLVFTFTPLLLEVRDMEAGWGDVSFTIRNHGLLRDCLTDVKIISPEGMIGRILEWNGSGNWFVGWPVDSICINGLSEVKIGKRSEKDNRYYSIELMTKDGYIKYFTDIEKLKMELVFQSGKKIPIETMVTKTVQGNFTGFPSLIINATVGIK
jgi:hypothetical protein